MARKRGNNEGSIYQRKSDGRWVASLHTDRDVGGGASDRRFFYADTRAKAAAILTAELKKVQDGLVTEPGRQTVGQFLDSWMDTVVRDSVRPATYTTYTYVLKHAEPIRRVLLSKLTSQQVQKLLSTLHTSGGKRKKAKGLGNEPEDEKPAGLGRTVAVLHAILHQAFDLAVRWNLVPRNIMDAVSVPRRPAKEMHPLSQGEVSRLLKAAQEDRLYALYVLAVSCGLRFGELLGLRWSNIDFDKATLTTAHQIDSRDGGVRFVPLKTAKSRRTVRLPQLAVAALKKHRQKQLAERLKLGEVWRDYNLVFCSEIGTPLSESNVRNRSFYPLLEAAGLPRIRFHDLRHTCATLLLGQGVHPKLVQEQLGHSRIGTTLDTYSHVALPMMDEIATRMDSLLSTGTDKDSRG